MKKETFYWFKERRISRKVMKECVGFKAKTYSYLIDNSSERKNKQKTQESVS